MRMRFKKIAVWLMCIILWVSCLGSSITVLADNTQTNDSVITTNPSEKDEEKNEYTKELICDCGSEDNVHAETCPLYKAPEEADESGAAQGNEPACSCESTDDVHAETCPLYKAPEEADESEEGQGNEPVCSCASEDGVHAETCPLYKAPEEADESGAAQGNEPVCDCGSTDGIHAETCPCYTDSDDEGTDDGMNIPIAPFSLMPNDGARDLTPLKDDTYVQSVTTAIDADGSAPFDGNNDPGNDADAHNKIVRSFDTLVYEITIAVESKQQKYYDSDTLCFEAVLPVSEKEAVFDTASMSYLDTCSVEQIDGKQVLTATYRLEKDDKVEYAVPGTGNIKLYIKVLAMKNGSSLQPTAKFWMENNEKDPETGEVEAAVDGVFDPVRVSAGLKMNVQLKEASKSATSVQGTFSLTDMPAYGQSEGERYGRLFCYGITLQLYNADRSRGLRGMELPDGEITLKLNYSASYTQTAGDKNTYSADSPEMAEFQPLVYSVEGNSNAFTQADGRVLASQEGYRPGQRNASNAAPYNQGGGYNGCENGGSWSATLEDDGELTLRIKDYTIDALQFPHADTNYTEDYYTYYEKDTQLEDIGTACFSAGEVWLLLPYEDESGQDILNKLGAGIFTLTVEDSDLTAYSVTGQSCGAQQKTDDDQAVLTSDRNKAGIFVNRLFYSYGGSGINFMNLDILGGGNYVNNGKDFAIIGQKGNIGIAGGFDYSAEGVGENRLAAYNSLLKFDGSALKLNGVYDLPENYGQSTRSDIYWGYLEDERNWRNDDEMQEAREQDLLWDSSFQEDRNYVAVLLENRITDDSQNATSMRYVRFFCGMEIREDAEADRVYMLCESTRIWSVSQMERLGITAADIPSAASSDYKLKSFPAADCGNAPVYTKAVYHNGVYTGGHTGDRDIGDSLYLMNVRAEIDLKVAQKTTGTGGTEELKYNYNLDRGERTVDFVITPKLVTAYDAGAAGNKTTVNITVTIPAGMSYLPGSAYLGGVYQQTQEGKQGSVTGGADLTASDSLRNADGSVTVTWTLSDVPLQNGELEKIYFSCELGDEGNPDKDLTDNESKTVTAAISTDEDKRELTVYNANLSNTSVRVTALGTTSFGASVEKSLNEVNENIVFLVNYYHKDNRSICVVDAMPYNNDNSGSTFSGTYSVQSWQVDLGVLGGAEKLGKLQLYYTTDTRYQDVSLGDGAEGSGTVSQSTIESEWKKCEISSDGKAEFPNTPVAWAVIGDNLGAGENLRIRMELEQSDASGTDVLANKASEGNFYRIVNARRVQRKVSGTAWMDENGDGRMDGSESRLSGLKVTLQVWNDDNTTWATARNLSGEDCVTVTGSDGSYSFHDLAAGSYQVVFADGDTSQPKFKHCSLTVKEAPNVSAALSSKAEAVIDNNTGALQSAVIGNVILPEAADILESPYVKAGLNAGFCRMPVTVILTGTKTLSSVTGTVAPELEAGAYTFVLKDAQKNVLQEKTNGAGGGNGAIVFDELEFYAVGEYTYSIEEVIPDQKDPCIIYDENPVDVTVQIELDSEGKLSPQVTFQKEGKSVTTAEFINKYQRPQTVTVTLNAQKVLEGRELLKDQFSFILKPRDGAPMPIGDDGSMLASVTAKNDENGNIVFPTISISETQDTLLTAGGADKYEYRYEITEEKGSDASYAYDGQVITAVVTITKGADYRLNAQVSYESSRKTQEKGLTGLLKGLLGKETSQNVFCNTYVAPTSTQLVLTGTKQLSGRNIKSNEFVFVLTPQKDAPGEVQRVSCKEDGTFEFDALIFEKDEFPDNLSEKTYTYVISEDAGKNPSYCYDAKEVTVQVTLKKTGADGASKIEIDKITYSKDAELVNEIAFRNIYTKPEGVKVELQGKKLLQGKDLEAGQFTFILTPVGDAPGEVQKVKNQADGSFVFGEIAVEEDREKLDFGDGSESLTFRYRISEQNDGAANYSYDSSAVVATIKVKKNKDNKLEVTDISYQKDAKAVKEISFTNVYQESPSSGADTPKDKTSETVSSEKAASNTGIAENTEGAAANSNSAGKPATGDSTPVTVWIILLIAALFAAGGVILFGRNKNRKKRR